MKKLYAYGAPALLIVFFLLTVTAASGKSATYDESVHIFSGWRILTSGDYATNHEHPPLMKMLAAAPLLMMDVKPPRTEMKREVDEWAVSHEFVYHVNDGDTILRAARLPITLLAVLLGWAVYRSAAAALGETAGLVTLGLLTFEPNMLAHSSLVTTDLGITAFTFFTFAAFVTHLRGKSGHWLLGTGAMFGLALLTKFTAVLLVPILAVAGALVIHLEGSGSWGRLFKSLAVVIGIGLLVLNLGYGFGGTFSTLRSFTPESQQFRGYASGALGSIPLPLPREYVRGFDHAEAGGQRWWSYLLGQHSMTGWRHYYLVALAVKTPLPLLLMAAAGLLAGAGVRKLKEAQGTRKLRAADTLLPLVPVIVILSAFTFSANIKNIGLRYILPIYPFLCVMGGVASRLPLRAWMLGAVLAWQAGAAAWLYPDYLTFFNLTVGGPRRGAEVLLDSNLDWGQDLKGLGLYIREHRIGTIYVDYFGRGCLKYYGVKSTPDFEGGYIAVSATNLKGVYSDPKDRYRFLWSLEPEARIGGSIFVYNVARPPDWKPKPGAAGD
jgi:4-amino-4-deoxy-L-arabinose transferase-like glycosyltransferase